MKRLLLSFLLIFSTIISFAQSWQGKPVVRIENDGQSFLYTFSDSSTAYINKCNVSYIVNMPNSVWVQVGYMYDGSTSRIITASYSAITQPDLASAKILSDTLSAWLRDCQTSGGGSGDSIAVIRTYAQAKAEYDAKALTAGRQYLLTDFASIYDQSISDVTKTASGEQLILTATSDSTFNPVVQSIEFPTDIIHYDITVDTTFINAAPAKGKITYRESVDGNKANYDWRKVLMYNSNTTAEALTFDLGQGVYSTEVTTPTGQNIAWTGFEFPASYITGATYHNPDNLMINTYVIGDFSHNSGNLFFSCNLGGVNQTANSNFNTVEVGGEISQCTAISLDNVSITGNLTSSVTGTWAASTFGENVNKCIEVNFNNTTVTGRIDRLVNSFFLTDTLGGQLYWCENVAMFNCNIANDFRGVNSTHWSSTRSNCKVEQIKGLTQNADRIGFTGCTITGTTSGSVFGNLIVECLVSGKVITQALYPELFSEVYSKVIYKTPDGDVFYRFLDDTNTWVFTQIP